MKLSLYFKVVFCLLLLSCSRESNPHLSDQMDTFISDFNLEIKERYSLEPTSYGGNYQKQIKRVVLNFNSNYSLDKTKAVFLVQRITDDFLFYLNRSQELIQFLDPRPFTREQIDLTIDFYDIETKKWVLAPSIASVRLKDGRMSVFTYDSKQEKLVPS
jgi:hypothetical protein